MLRLLAAAAALLVLIVLGMVATAAVVFAQEAAPVPAAGGYEAMIGLVRESFTAALMAGATLLLGWFATTIKKWTAGRIDLDSTLEALEWERYVDDASRKSFSYAQIKLGLTPEKLKTEEEKGGFLAWALHYMRSHHEDIVAFADKNGNGVVDILEAQLAKIAPDHVFPAGTAQGFMASPKRRAAPAPKSDDSGGMMTPAAMAARRGKRDAGDL